MNSRNQNMYMVIVKEMGEYVLCTRRVFLTKLSALEYAAQCSPSREAKVISGDFLNLRHTHVDMSDQIGFLMDGKVAVCMDCGNRNHVLAHDTNAPLYRAAVHPYRQTCNMCGTIMAEGKASEFAEIYSNVRSKATVREMKAITVVTPPHAIRPRAQYAYVNGQCKFDTDVDSLQEER